MKIIANQEIEVEGKRVLKGQEVDVSAASAAMLCAHGYASYAAKSAAPEIETAAAAPVAETAARKTVRRATTIA
jgi:hypothetical protein